MNGRLEHEFQILDAVKKVLLTLPDYVNEWYECMYASDKEPSVLRDYTEKIKRFLKSINDCPKLVKKSDITFSNVMKYYNSIKHKIKNGELVETSGSYQATVWHCLNNFLEFMYNMGYIEKNYMKMIEKPKVKDLQRINSERLYLTFDDFDKIIQTAQNGTGSDKAKACQEKSKSRDLLILRLFMVTGMRKTALSEINLSDFSGNILTIRDKGDKRFECTLSEDDMIYLNNWLEDRKLYPGSDDNEALFLSNRGSRMHGNSIYKVVNKYSKDALGLEKNFGPHKIRGGFISLVYRETGDAELARRAAGHNNITVTQRYIKTDDTERAKAAAIISNGLRK